MTEGIKIDGSSGFRLEFLLKIGLPYQDLPYKGLTAGQVAVGLQVPSPHDMPPALLYQPVYPGEESRFVRLYPLV